MMKTEKRILPKATKSSMVKLVRAKGYDVPSLYQAVFERHGRAFWLRWVDKGKASHSAYYTGAGGRPVLQVDKTWIDLTMAEVIHFGLYEEK